MTFLQSTTSRTLTTESANTNDLTNGLGSSKAALNLNKYTLQKNGTITQKVLRNLFKDNKILRDELDLGNANLSYLQKTIINNEYNLHYLDLLVCGYAVAYSDGGNASATVWWKEIERYINNAKKDSASQENVVFRVDVGMCIDDNGKGIYASTGDVLNTQYGLYNNDYAMSFR